MITLHQNKEKDCCLKTLGQTKDLKGDEDDDELPLILPLKGNGGSTSKQPAKKPKVDEIPNPKPLKVIHPLTNKILLAPRKVSNILPPRKVSLLPASTKLQRKNLLLFITKTNVSSSSKRSNCSSTASKRSTSPYLFDFTFYSL